MNVIVSLLVTTTERIKQDGNMEAFPSQEDFCTNSTTQHDATIQYLNNIVTGF
jgi:hypothetical protein